MPPSEADRTAYEGIVDGFGQFRPGQLAGKGQLDRDAARQGRRRSAASWRGGSLMQPMRDRFGGLMSSPCLRGDGLFPHRAAGRQMVARHTRGTRLLLDRHRRGCAFRGDLCRGPRVHVPRSAGAGRRACRALERSGRSPRPGRQRGRSFDHGHAFDFYTANLERKFGAEWRSALARGDSGRG